MLTKTILCTLLTIGLSISIAYAEPLVKRSGNTITVKEALTKDSIARINQELASIKTPSFILEGINDEDLAKFCQTFPKTARLVVNTNKDILTNITPVAILRDLETFTLKAESVADMSPLAGLVKLTKLEINSTKIGPDLKWMINLTNLKKLDISASKTLTSFEGLPALQGNPSVTIKGAAPEDLSPLQGLTASRLNLTNCVITDLSPLTKMPNLSELSLYGATVKDFSPLANCPKLKKLTYYAVKEADFSTLSALKQVVELKGGLTKLNNIAFVAELPELRTFDVFAEYVTNYSPLASSKIEKLQIWSMREPVGDLGIVGKATSIKELKLWSVDGATNSAGLAGLTKLEKFIITSDYNKKSGEAFDLTCAKGWGKLRSMEITGTRVVNTINLAALASLEKLALSKVNVEGIPFSLAGLAKLPKLNTVEIIDSQIADFEALAACPELSYITIKNSKGVTNLTPIKALPKLKRVIVSKGSFPNSELTGFANSVKIEQR